MEIPVIKIEYPNLPVVEHKQEFFELLEKHQVIIVKADTGSGKSTQLPKFLLEYFIAKKESCKREENVKFKIGVTEPRRLAAISIADRLREELKDNTLVSTKIRFWEDGAKDAPLKVMTDGILLQEFRKDRLFRQYNAIIIDEAHERSLNIDILIGIFKSVLRSRKDFKLIIASATLDAKLFEEFYENCCTMEAEGRTFPVDVEYYFQENADYKDEKFEEDLRDVSGKGDSRLIEEARDAILDLETRHRDNLLCFLPTERDIQDLADELQHELDSNLFDILPLFGRMSPDEQRRVFKSCSKTRVVLATNIAETSLTIPGIAYVVDTGMARISRYNAQTRIQGLPIEKVSKASAEQRKGRAGRVKTGVCIRLYSKEDFENRDEFTEPEIRRSNLANVVLQLKSLGLEMETFPFLQPPPHSAFRGAYKTLFELGALTSSDAYAKVTKLGHEMTNLPMDVSLSAVLLRSRDRGVLQPALIVCSALSIQDPRVVPNDEPERTRIRQLHRKYCGHKSDFITYLTIWNAFCNELDGKSWNKLRKFCEKNSMHFLRLREWIDLYEQFCRILNVKFETRVCPIESFHRDNLHIALLSGFLGGIAHRDLENSCYRLVNGRETHVFPGSDLYAKSIEWIFSAEIRETSRVFLTNGAEIKPEWILQIAESFCTRRWFEPVWNRERGFVEAVEEVRFRGLVIRRGHRVDYARVNPDDCAQIFWREAVVLGDMARPFSFMTHNERVVENLQAIETRKRQFGLAPSEDALVEYYTRIAHNVNSIRTLKEYIFQHTDQFLKFDEAYWIDVNGFSNNLIKTVDFRNHIIDAFSDAKAKKTVHSKSELGGSIEQFRIENRIVNGEMVFDATRECDGISIDLPFDILPEISPAKLALAIPQWREWMIDSVFREMPKVLKKELETSRTQIDDEFYASLEKSTHKAPLLLLYEVLSNRKEICKNGNLQMSINFSTINPDKENHLRLHLKIFKSGITEKYPVELSPEWGSYRMFFAIRPLILNYAIDFSLENKRFGWYLNNSKLMESTESLFWQSFRKRIEKCFEQSNNELNGKLSLVLDRLNLLETGGVFADGFETVLKTWVQKSLVADNFDAKLCERFSGLEYSRGKRIHDFKNLAVSARTEDEEVRLSLVRVTYESGLLGADYFVKCWDLLKNFSIAMRHTQYNKTPRNLVVSNLFLVYQKVDSLFERLCCIKNAFESGCSNISFGSNPELTKHQESLNIRELFRPFLKSRYLKDHELKAARELLGNIERNSIEEKDFDNLFLHAKSMLEEFEILRYKRKGDDADEMIEEDALAKLKGRFGKLR